MEIPSSQHPNDSLISHSCNPISSPRPPPFLTKQFSPRPRFLKEGHFIKKYMLENVQYLISGTI